MLDAVYYPSARHIDQQYVAVLAHYLYYQFLVDGKSELIDCFHQYFNDSVVLVLQDISYPGGAQMLPEHHTENRRVHGIFGGLVHQIRSGVIAC